MSASFPASAKTFTTKSDGAGNFINASHVNDLQDEVAAMESAFVNGKDRASAYHNTTQSIADSSTTSLNLNSEDFDTDALHDPSTNNTRLTAARAGFYLVVGGTTWAANATGSRQLDIRKNGGATFVATSIVAANTAGSVTRMQVVGVANLAANDYVELRGSQTSGGPLNAGDVAREAASFLQLIRIW